MRGIEKGRRAALGLGAQKFFQTKIDNRAGGDFEADLVKRTRRQRHTGDTAMGGVGRDVDEFLAVVIVHDFGKRIVVGFQVGEGGIARCGDGDAALLLAAHKLNDDVFL